MDQQQAVENEVRRRLAAEQQRHHEETSRLMDIVKEQQDKLLHQHDLIQRLTGEPLTFGVVHAINDCVDPSAFQVDDRVIVCDQDSPHYQKTGTIVGLDEESDDDTVARVFMSDDTEEEFRIGINGNGQIRLAEKPDGTSTIVSIEGRPWEVQGIPNFGIKVGDTVKVKPESKQIVDLATYDVDAGSVCIVESVTDDGVEVLKKGEKHLVCNPKDFTLEEGDRVCIDSGEYLVLKKLLNDARDRYRMSNNLDVTFDNVGGLENAKTMIRDFLELPYTEKERFAHYGMKRPIGALLYGPPGCGKTLLARVCAWLVAKVHGQEAIDSGYIFVKGPEILDKYVGNSEGEVRSLFERGRRHFQEHGYPAILAIDEADAIIPERGMRRSSDVADTIVPMFLGEMDGIDEEQTRCNPIVLLMTNRPDVLDPAVVRSRRISHHIKIDRPNEYSAIDILTIHTSNTPFKGDKDSALAIAASDIYSKSRLLYRVNNEHDFTLGDAVNGAMLEQIAEDAKMIALRRDIDEGTMTGVDIVDFRKAIDDIYDQQQGLNHKYDLRDFAEKKHIQAEGMEVSRCFGAA